MDSPNRMANSITGRKASMGPGPPTWKTDPSQPHWNTATKTPKAAPMESIEQGGDLTPEGGGALKRGGAGGQRNAGPVHLKGTGISFRITGRVEKCHDVVEQVLSTRANRPKMPAGSRAEIGHAFTRRQEGGFRCQIHWKQICTALHHVAATQHVCRDRRVELLAILLNRS